MKRKLILLLCLIMVIISLSAVSASDLNQSNTEDIVLNNTLSISEETDIVEANEDGTFTDLQNMIDKSNKGATVVLDRDYKYDDSFSTKGITVNKTLTIDGKGHTLNALSKSHILYVNASNVVLKNINFINANAHDIDHDESYDYDYEYGAGGAIQWHGTYGKLTDCYFENNCAEWDGSAVKWLGDYGTICNCIFEKNTGFMGGGTSISGSNVTITNSTFRDNHCDGAGAMLWTGSNGTLSDSTFTGNTAKYIEDEILSVSSGDLLSLPVSEDVLGGAMGLGGAVVWWGENCLVNNCRFTSNSVTSKGSYSGGGAVYLDASNTNFTNCIFENNHALSKGGAIYGHESCSVEACQFINNDANENGGAIYWDGCSGTIKGNTFSNNFAENGGAIYSAVETIIDSCDFFENTANYGGALYVANDKLTVSYSNFINNTANYNGGALSASGITHIIDSTFRNNSANDNGGAIMSYGYVSIDYSDFISNTASNGGALYLDGASSFGSEIESYIDYSNFKDNSALEWGGAIFNERDLTIFSSEFDSNSAQNGGAISSYNGYVNDKILINNKIAINQDYRIILRGENIFNNNSAIYGGAIFIGLDEYAYTEYGKYGRLEIYGDSYFLSSTDKLKGGGPIGSSRFRNNHADLFGGAIYVIHTEADIQNAEFVDNTAGIGGAILSQGYSTMNINISGFINNSADEIGGAVFAQNNLRVYNSKFENSINQEAIYYSNISDINSGTLHLVGNNIKTSNPYAIVYESASKISSPTSLILESQNVLKGSTFKIAKLVDDMGNVIVGPDISITLIKNPESSLKKGNSEVLRGAIEGEYYQFVLKSNYTIGGYNFKCELPEGVYDVSGYVLDVNMEDFKCIDCVLSVSDIIFAAPTVIKYAGGNEKFTVKLADNKGKAIGGHELSITINSKTYNLKTDSKGITTVDLDLPVGLYEVTVLSEGIKVTSNVTVLSTIAISDATGSYLNSKVIGEFKNIDGSALANAKVTFKINGTNYAATTNAKGVATANVNLGADVYSVTAINPINKEEKSSKLTISKADSTITLVNSKNSGVVTLTATVPGKATGNVAFNVNGTSYTKAISNGKAVLSLNDLSAGDYAATASYTGDNNFNAADDASTSFNVKETAILTVKDLTKTYGNSQKLTVKLKDKNGVAIANKDVTVVMGTKTQTLRTDKNGQVTFNANIVPATYSATVTFAGDGKYDPSTATAKVIVKKATPKITAKKATFKKSVKTKKYTITLKANGKVMKKTKLTLKVKGKTYKATTNNKGKATFKITKLTKKGSFKATISFKATKYYNKANKNIYIKVK